MFKWVTTLMLLVTGLKSQGQTYGLLLSGGYRDLYAAGQVFAPAKGLRVGAFMPFYVRDRLVVRAELGLTAYNERQEVLEQSTSQTSVAANITLLGRYYVSPKICFSLGAECQTTIAGAAPVAFGRKEEVPSSTDIVVILGAAHRIGRSLEIGLRYGQGMNAVLEMDQYGKARHRYGAVVLSYLLKNNGSGFMARRGWRNPLPMGCRY